MTFTFARLPAVPALAGEAGGKPGTALALEPGTASSQRLGWPCARRIRTNPFVEDSVAAYRSPGFLAVTNPS